MAASGGACWYAGHRNQDRKLILGGKEVPLAQQYAAIGVISIPLFVIAGAGAVSFIKSRGGSPLNNFIIAITLCSARLMTAINWYLLEGFFVILYLFLFG